jgi:type II secretory pathway component PulF
MNTYAYVALEPSGKKKSGFVDAANVEAASAKITAEGRFVLELKEQNKVRTISTQAEGKKKGGVSRADIALFSRRMSDLAEAGLPLDRVLRVVAEQSESATLTQIAETALEEVRGGKSVSDALSAFPKYFPTVYTQTLKAGEASGQFPEVVGRLAEFQENEVQRRSTIISAMIYPSMLLLTAFGVIVFLLTFVVPRMSGIFEDLGDELPASTKILLAVTNFLTHQWPVIVGAIIAAIVGYKVWSASEQGGLQRDTLLLKAPLIGPIVQKSTVSRFSRVLGTLLYGGVPILNSLELAGLASGNRLFMKSAEIVEDEVREGRPIAEAMRNTNAFPPVLTHMVAIGEETGDLPKMLGRVSNSLDFEVDNGLRRLTATLEPLIMVFMAVFVGFVVISIILPIYQAGDLVK